MKHTRKIVNIMVVTVFAVMFFLPLRQAAALQNTSLKMLLSNFSAILTETSEKLMSISDEFSAAHDRQEVEHVFIFSELLLIKTIINYENRLILSERHIRNDMRSDYYRLRVAEMQNARAKIRLALGRIKRHTANLLEAKKERSGNSIDKADMKDMLLLNDLQHTIEKILILFDMSIRYFDTILRETQGQGG